MIVFYSYYQLKWYLYTSYKLEVKRSDNGRYNLFISLHKEINDFSVNVRAEQKLVKLEEKIARLAEVVGNYEKKYRVVEKKLNKVNKKVVRTNKFKKILFFSIGLIVLFLLAFLKDPKLLILVKK